MRYKIFKVPNYVKIYPIVYFFFYLAVGIITPVQIIFFRHIGLSLFQIGLVSTILETSIMIFEIPTGYIADKLGRNISVICSFISFIIAGAIFLCFQNVYGVAIGTFIQGIGYTCVSGAFEAWSIDKLISNGNKKDTDKLIVSATQSRRIGFLIGSITGGYFGLKLINTAWMSYILINVVCLILVVIFMKENKDNICNIHDDDDDEGSVFSRFFLIDSNIIISFIIILGIVSVLHEFSISPVDEYWTVFFTENLKIPDFWLGWVIASGEVLIVIFVAPIVTFLMKKFGAINALKGITIFVVFSVLLLAISGNPVLAIAFYIVFKFSLGIYEPIQATYINSIVKGEYRATILSIYSMLGAIGEIISGVAIGFISEATSIRIAFMISAIGFSVIIVLLKILNSIEKSGKYNSKVSMK